MIFPLVAWVVQDMNILWVTSQGKFYDRAFSARRPFSGGGNQITNSPYPAELT
jgi:hypothetical protein